MMLCPKCGRTMKNIKHFEPGRNYQFNVCKCMFQTHQKRIHFDEETKEDKEEKKYARA